MCPLSLLTSLRCGCLALLLCLFSSAWALASTGEALCVRRFQKKHFLLAAKCFQRLVDGVNDKSSEELRMQAGSWLRNAALAYKQAAAKEKDPQRATYLRERGLRLLQRYLKNKMYRTQTQQRIAKTMLDSFEEKIGYTTLTILPSDPKAEVQVLGYRFKQTLTGGGAIQVRPGRYTVMVLYPNQQRDAKAIKLKARTPYILRFGLPQAAVQRREPPRRPALRPLPVPQRRSNPAGWIIAGIGGAALVAGVVLVAVSVTVTDQNAEVTLGRAKEANDPVLTREAGELHAAASTQYIVGWIVLGVGAAGLATGIGLGVAGVAAKPDATAKMSVARRAATPHQRALLMFDIDTP